MLRRLVAICAGFVLVLSGCSSTDDGGDADEPTEELVPEATALDADRSAELTELVGDGTCDALDPNSCLLPFPSAHFTVDDEETETGKLVAFPEGLLANDKGSTLDPTEWNRNDGFSPGTPILVDLGDVDLEASSLPRIGDIGASMQSASTSVLLDLDSGERIPHWAEIDQAAADGEGLLIIRPAIALPEGHTIGVGIGSVPLSSGSAAEPSLAFEVYRDNLTTDIEAIESRRVDMEALFDALSDAEKSRDELVAGWTFNVASGQNLSERLLTMRDRAFENLGDAAPGFSIDEVVTDDVPDGIARSVRGTYDVPLFLTESGAPGARISYGEDDLPEYVGSEFKANFTCQVPNVALEGDGGNARPVIYGHGLLGSASESQNSQVAKIASTNNMVYCATDWIGMSAEDIGTAAQILGDVSFFPAMPDRSQQGILNMLFLARTMTTDGGFGSAPEFQTDAGESVFDTTEAYYDGNSQGGIMGGAATAVSQEWTKAVLGVPGMNYSTLLSRSVDFNEYFVIMKGAYPDTTDQQLLYGVMQMLWDRGETNGYAQHVTANPYENTPEHDVLLHVAFGDHQVAQVTAEIMARTMGAVIRQPALADGRHPDTSPFYGLESVDEFPFDGSALIYFDSGTLAPPAENITPHQSEIYEQECSALDEDALKKDYDCADPHESPRRAPASIEQKDSFFSPDGQVEDTCDGKPCEAELRANLDY